MKKKKDKLLSKEALIEAFSRDIYFSESTKAAIRSVIHAQPSVGAEKTMREAVSALIRSVRRAFTAVPCR